MSKPGKPGKLRRMGSGDGETSPALGSPGGGRVTAMLSGGGAAPAPASSTGRRNSVAASVFGDAPGDGAEGSPSEPARPLPECLDAQNIGKIVLMHAAPPRSTKAGAEPTTRSGKELWASLRLTLRDGTTRSWLGLTEKVEGADESLVDKTEKKARSEAVLAGMYLDDTKFRQTWDSAQIALLVYIAVLVPFRIGFDQNTDPGDFFFIFDVGVDIYFIVDVYLSFNTTRQDNEGKLVWKKRDVRIGYMKGWFTIDLLGCLPLHYLPLLPGIEADSDAMKSNKSVRLLRLARLLKLLRLARINRLLARYEEQLFAFMSSIKMGKTVMMMIFIGHWMCCVWYYAGSQPQELDEFDSNGDLLQGWVLQNFGGVENFNHTDVATRYMTSMYYAYATMTTVGYGDISATTYIEKIAAVFSMIIGGFVFGLIVGTLSDLSAQANPLDRVKTKQLSKVVGILQGRTPAVKQRVVKEVRKYFALKYQHETAIDLKPYLFDLPEALRNDVARELQYVSTKGDRAGEQTEGILHHVPFFSELDHTSLIMICLRMKFWSKDVVELEEDGTRKNDIISEGTYGNEMFVIARGTCDVITTHGKYKDWPTFKEDHVLTTLVECGLTADQADAIKAIDTSVAQHVKSLPKGWMNKSDGSKQNDSADEGSQWDACGIDHEQAVRLLEHGGEESLFALTNAAALNDEQTGNIAKVVIDAHQEMQQMSPPGSGGQKGQRELGQLWRLPLRVLVRGEDEEVGGTKQGKGSFKDTWAPPRQAKQALTKAQKQRLTDLKRQYPPSSTSPYLHGTPSCDAIGEGKAARPDQTGVVKMGKLEQGDFFGESAVLLPHSAKGVIRTRSVYGVRSDDMPNVNDVHLFVLSHEDVKQMEVERPAIKHMLLPYRRQAMANAYRAQFTGLAKTASSHGAGLGAGSTLEEGDEGEEEEDDEEYGDMIEAPGRRSPSPSGSRAGIEIPEHSTDSADATVSRSEFDALSREVRAMQSQLQAMNESITTKLDRLLER